MPLPDFKSEAEFRTKWIAPFLSKLGYILVNRGRRQRRETSDRKCPADGALYYSVAHFLGNHIHGSGEQGKDFFFADFDRFEHQRFYAAQVKLGNIGAGQGELEDLLNQGRAPQAQLAGQAGGLGQTVSGELISGKPTPSSALGYARPTVASH